MLDQVLRFQEEVIGQPIPKRPTMISGQRKDYCLDHLTEELNEFRDAKSVKGQADAILDLVYVGLGRLVEMGVLPRAAFDDLHAKNMRKKKGTRAKRPNSMGLDAVRPPDFKEMDWPAILSTTYDDVRRISRFRRKPRLLVLGYGRHGKDTVCEMLRDDLGYTFASSSMTLAEEVVFPRMRDRYQTVEDCYADRANHRSTWYDLLTEYNTPDKARLARVIYGKADIYCGLRSAREFHAVKREGLFHTCIWVDRSEHEPPESRDSCTVEPWMADYVLDNNNTIEETRTQLYLLVTRIEEQADRAKRREVAYA